MISNSLAESPRLLNRYHMELQTYSRTVAFFLRMTPLILQVECPPWTNGVFAAILRKSHDIMQPTSHHNLLRISVCRELRSSVDVSFVIRLVADRPFGLSEYSMTFHAKGC